MEYAKLSSKEKFLIMDLCELAMAGDVEAKESLSIIAEEEITTVSDIYKIQKMVFKSFTQSERGKELDGIQTRLKGPIPIPVKPIRPQDKWNEKNGLVSKSYKLKQDVISNFATACDKSGVSQAGQLTKMMQDFISAQ